MLYHENEIKGMKLTNFTKAEINVKNKIIDNYHTWIYLRHVKWSKRHVRFWNTNWWMYDGGFLKVFNAGWILNHVVIIHHCITL